MAAQCFKGTSCLGVYTATIDNHFVSPTRTASNGLMTAATVAIDKMQALGLPSLDMGGAPLAAVQR
jgi:hypothetical protein